jgi:hypothetical protein
MGDTSVGGSASLTILYANQYVWNEKFWNFLTESSLSRHRRELENPMPQLDRDMARALTEAGYMPVGDYLSAFADEKRFGCDAQPLTSYGRAAGGSRRSGAPKSPSPGKKSGSRPSIRRAKG